MSYKVQNINSKLQEKKFWKKLWNLKSCKSPNYEILLFYLIGRNKLPYISRPNGKKNNKLYGLFCDIIFMMFSLCSNVALFLWSSHESVRWLQKEYRSYGGLVWWDDISLFLCCFWSCLFELPAKHLLYVPLEKRFGSTWWRVNELFNMRH